MATRSGPARDRRRLVRLALVVVAVPLGFVALAVLPGWFFALVPPWVLRRASIAFLWILLVGYLIGLAVATAGVVVLGGLLYRARRLRRAWPTGAKLLALCVSVLFGLLLLEAGAAVLRAQAHRPPELPTQFETGSASANARSVSLAVIGESSARGEPYHPWLSVGQIAGWQLERVFSGRRFDVDILAAGGICLEQAILPLAKLQRRPDAILVYAGHNEFLARYAWDRNVRHYLDEGPPPRRVLMELAAGRSSFVALVDELLERNRLPFPPPDHVTRELVDHPTCTPVEYAFLRSEYGRWLEFVVSYCERIGALAIVVIPAGNEADFPPRRSILPPEATQADRSAFARAFQAARALEDQNEPQAIRAFEGLVARQPGFAESHYRLARLKARAGDWRAAAHHYTLARDLDAMPMRCPSDFQELCRAVAKRHPGVILVDGPALLRARSAHGVIGDRLMHDAQHPNLCSYIALAQDLLNQLAQRRAFGWSSDRAVPVMDPTECAAHFGLDREKWVEVCKRSESFYSRTAYSRYDPSENLARADLYRRAAEAIASGRAPEEVGVPGLGTRPDR